MSRDSRCQSIYGPPADPTPNEVLRFARAVLGESFPHNRMRREQDTKAEREQLLWLAEISTTHERQLRNLLREEAIARESREHDPTLIEREDSATEEWDDAKHPRLGGPPNAGWFASTGGSAASEPSRGSASPKPDTVAHPRREQFSLAQAPPQGQPPAQGGPQGPAPGNERHRNPFGTWPKRPAGFIYQPIRDNGMGRFHKWQVTRAYNALPKPVQDILRNNRVEVSLDKDGKDLRAQNPEMKADAIGGYDSSTGIIHLFDTLPIPGGAVAPAVGLDHAVRHEVGHAVDHYLNDMSQTPEFMRAYQADKNAALNHPALSNTDKHYLSKPAEAFAEAFARTLEGRKSPGVLPNSMMFLQRSPTVRQLLATK